MQRDENENMQWLTHEARLIEAIIYLENEPADKKRLTTLSGLPAERVSEVLEELSRSYETFDHGIRLIEVPGGFQFSPAEDLWDSLKEEYGRHVDRRMSRAALESLSIIAYSQPITKKEIEIIRGVSSDTILRILQERDFITVIGRKDVPGRPYLYGTTRKFLEEFNLKSISSLPRLNDIERERFNVENE